MDHDTNIRPIQNKRIVESRLNLPEIIDYNNEFGPELICFIPTVFWLKSAGLLEGKKVKIFPGMRSLYYFLSDHEIVTEMTQGTYTQNHIDCLIWQIGRSIMQQKAL